MTASGGEVGRLSIVGGAEVSLFCVLVFTDIIMKKKGA